MRSKIIMYVILGVLLAGAGVTKVAITQEPCAEARDLEEWEEEMLSVWEQRRGICTETLGALNRSRILLDLHSYRGNAIWGPEKSCGCKDAIECYTTQARLKEHIKEMNLRSEIYCNNDIHVPPQAKSRKK